MCALDCVSSLIFFDAPVSRWLSNCIPHVRPHRCWLTSGTLFWIFQHFQHVMYLLSYLPGDVCYPNHTVSSMCRLDILGTHMEEDESPHPRSDASTWRAWEYDGTIQYLKIHIGMTDALIMDYRSALNGSAQEKEYSCAAASCSKILTCTYLYFDALQPWESAKPSIILQSNVAPWCQLWILLSISPFGSW